MDFAESHRLSREALEADPYQNATHAHDDEPLYDGNNPLAAAYAFELPFLCKLPSLTYPLEVPPAEEALLPLRDSLLVHCCYLLGLNVGPCHQ